MMVTVSQVFILALAIVVCALCVWGVFWPSKLTGMVRGVMNHVSGIYFAVIVRLLMGLSLIIAAPPSRFPVIFELLGWITIIAAVVLPLIGRERIVRLIAWFEGSSRVLGRAWLVFGLAFGGFLIYGV